MNMSIYKYIKQRLYMDRNKRFNQSFDDAIRNINHAIEILKFIEVDGDNEYDIASLRDVIYNIKNRKLKYDNTRSSVFSLH